jgi:hypothetical protein
MIKQEFDNVVGFRNRYSVDLVIHNLLFIVTRRGSLRVMRDNTTAHTSSNSVDALDEVSGKLVTRRGFLPLRSLDLNSHDFHMWGTPKRKVYVKNTQYLEELNDVLGMKFPPIPVQQP